MRSARFLLMVLVFGVVVSGCSSLKLDVPADAKVGDVVGWLETQSGEQVVWDSSAEWLKGMQLGKPVKVEGEFQDLLALALPAGVLQKERDVFTIRWTPPRDGTTVTTEGASAPADDTATATAEGEESEGETKPEGRVELIEGVLGERVVGEEMAAADAAAVTSADTAIEDSAAVAEADSAVVGSATGDSESAGGTESGAVVAEGGDASEGEATNEAGESAGGTDSGGAAAEGGSETDTTPPPPAPVPVPVPVQSVRYLVYQLPGSGRFRTDEVHDFCFGAGDPDIEDWYWPDSESKREDDCPRQVSNNDSGRNFRGRPVDRIQGKCGYTRDRTYFIREDVALDKLGEDRVFIKSAHTGWKAQWLEVREVEVPHS